MISSEPGPWGGYLNQKVLEGGIRIRREGASEPGEGGARGPGVIETRTPAEFTGFIFYQIGMLAKKS